MKFCTKCGNQMADDMIFCQNCGTKSPSAEDTSSAQFKPQETPQIHNATVAPKENTDLTPKLRTSMKIWMIVSFVFTGIFLIGCTGDISMLAGVCLFGILGLMFFFLPKHLKNPQKYLPMQLVLKALKGFQRVYLLVLVFSLLSFCLF